MGTLICVEAFVDKAHNLTFPNVPVPVQDEERGDARSSPTHGIAMVAWPRVSAHHPGRLLNMRSFAVRQAVFFDHASLFD